MSNSQNQVTVRSSFDGVVSYNVKAGKDGTAIAELTSEAALIKGGAALTALKDLALEVALSKAVNGKYRAASEILTVAFPAQAKAFDRLYGAIPWGTKATMLSYIEAMENAKPGKSGEWNKRQVAARALMSAMRNLPAFRKESAVIEMVATETAA